MTNEEKLAGLNVTDYIMRWAYTNILDDAQKAQFSNNDAAYQRYQDEGFHWLQQLNSIAIATSSIQRAIINELSVLDRLDLRLKLEAITGLSFTSEDVTRIQAVLKRITEEK